MPTTHLINVDLADVFKAPDRKDFIMTLGWGEEVEVVAQTAAHVEIKLTRFDEQPDGSIKPVETRSFIKPTASSRISASDVVIDKSQNRVLKVDFVDVRQGDGMAKVPHHGSSDFTPGFLQAVSPMISFVSSGDESARKEFIHLCATLMGALGRSWDSFSRVCG